MTIDWEEQWALFAPNFHNGCAHIELNNKRILRLRPGPGFGDLSHPTTRLTLSFLQEHITQDSVVLDIGCGSGILTLAASLLGANYAHGIDIDLEALSHAKLNQKSNELEHVGFSRFPPLSLNPTLILMNMIHSEQRLAWTYSYPALIITSGILTSQRADYLKLTDVWGWTLLSEREESSWLSFLFKS